MSLKAKPYCSTVLATGATVASALQITRAEANARTKTRTLELYHEERTQHSRLRGEVRPRRSHRPLRPRRLTAHAGATRLDRGAAATYECDRQRAEGGEFPRLNRHDDWRRRHRSCHDARA